MNFFEKTNILLKSTKKQKNFYLKIRSLSLSSVMMFALKLTQQNEKTKKQKNEKTKK